MLKAQFQYTVTLHLNENGYIVGVQMNTGDSICSSSDVRSVPTKTDYQYKVSILLKLNEPGPQ